MNNVESDLNSDLPLHEWSLPATDTLDLKSLHVIQTALVWEELAKKEYMCSTTYRPNLQKMYMYNIMYSAVAVPTALYTVFYPLHFHYTCIVKLLLHAHVNVYYCILHQLNSITHVHVIYMSESKR